MITITAKTDNPLRLHDLVCELHGNYECAPWEASDNYVWYCVSFDDSQVANRFSEEMARKPVKERVAQPSTANRLRRWLRRLFNSL
jgi:hypothetical protein